MSNIDYSETQKFESLASEWWDKQGKCRPLHDMNPTRLQFIIDRCHTIENKTILDIGCGAGILSESLAKRGAIVTGIDAAPSLIDAAKCHAKATYEQIASESYFSQAFSSLSYHVASAEEYSLIYPGTFDVVTCMELLEHVPDPLSLIKACAKLTKPGGQLFFSTLNRNMKSFLFAIVAAEYLLHLLPKRTHQYSKFIRPSELASALRKADLSLLELAGMQYNPLTRQTSLTKDVSVNYLAHALRTD